MVGRKWNTPYLGLEAVKPSGEDVRVITQQLPDLLSGEHRKVLKRCVMIPLIKHPENLHLKSSSSFVDQERKISKKI